MTTDHELLSVIAEMRALADVFTQNMYFESGEAIYRFADRIQSLLGGGWQDISTAPKDGTEILGWREDCGTILVRYTAPIDFCTDSECEALGDSAEQYDWFYADFICGGRLEGDEIPTHWQPLPLKPTGEL